MGWAAAQAGRAGLARWAPRQVTVRQREDGNDNLVEHLGSRLGSRLVAGVHLGPPRANRKPVLQLVDNSGRTVGFGKVGLNELTRGRVLAEAQALLTVGAHAPRRLRVPGVLAQGSWNGHPYCVTTPVATRSRLRGLNHPQFAAGLQELVHAFPVAQLPLAEAPWWRRLRMGLEASPEPDMLWLHHFAEQVERRAGWTELGFGAAHGDWSPWNVAVMDNCVVAWDWERFVVDAPVGLDGLHFALQSAARLEALSPAAAVGRVIEQSAPLVAANGARGEHGGLLVALYLLERGYRFVADGQRNAGARKGPIGEWLRPGLEAVVAALP